ADFFVVNIDHNGAALVVYDDTSNKLVQSPNSCSVQVADHCGAGVITVARQASGLGLFGTNVSGRSNAPVTGLSQPAGTALYPVIGGTNQTGMDIRSSHVTASRTCSRIQSPAPAPPLRAYLRRVPSAAHRTVLAR